jgi:hypothetical protein
MSSLNIPWNDVGGTPCCCSQEPTCTPSGSDSRYREIQINAAQYAELYAGGTAQCNFLMTGTSTFNRSGVCYTITASGTCGATANFVMDPNLCNRSDYGGTQPPATLAQSGTPNGTFSQKTLPCTVPTFRRLRCRPSAFMGYGIYNTGGTFPYGIKIFLNFSAMIDYTVGSNSATVDYGASTSTIPPNSAVILQLQSGNISVPTNTQVYPAPFETTTASWVTAPQVVFSPAAP